MTSVSVDMGSCGNKSRVIVKRNPSGEFDVNIETTCENVRAYSILLQKVTMNDIMGVKDNRITSYDTIRVLTPSCLVPAGVMTAAWMEIGMMPPERIGKGMENRIFVD